MSHRTEGFRRRDQLMAKKPLKLNWFIKSCNGNSEPLALITTKCRCRSKSLSLKAPTTRAKILLTLSESVPCSQANAYASMSRERIPAGDFHD
ncbi:hypothetical protein TNIN_180731 [Trichonephila inaurata madagascariensis]|uniref:Uncharacterized protein n=1 Tax=Trichonephila inaurata madagascariensis TaxID=2747483 RepID=A0A8X7CL12_9ARAC|nr:hypothetical protein TNIN_180731 [Trichonephila inaurata madagascariensis]